ncbi:MAG: hypothetical protein GXP33_10940 [Spirochaetes bacterium]|nr:hypothetical protein [Spirochaetota bacterium]
MNKLGIENINQDKIIIEVSDNPAGIAVKFSGDIDMEDPSTILDPLFKKLHEGILQQNIKEVVCDFRELNFLNSSGIKAMAKWIMKLSELDDSSKYSIKILYSKDITWQSTSLPTLTYLVPGAVTIE